MIFPFLSGKGRAEIEALQSIIYRVRASSHSDPSGQTHSGKRTDILDCDYTTTNLRANSEKTSRAR